MNALGLRSVALGAALFVYLTAELFPIGAQSRLADGLGVSDARVGLLLTAYAVVAGVVTLPAVALTRRVDRRTVLWVSMVMLAASQVGFALAPDYEIAAAFRAVAAAGHGLVWSQAPVVAVRLAPAGAAGRAASVAFVGSSLALILGAPLSSAAAGAVGWRAACLLLAAAAAAAAVLVRVSLPPVPGSGGEGGDGGRGEERGRTPRLGSSVWIVCAVTGVVVVGHYIGYSYLEPILARAHLAGAWLAPVLAAYGVAGLAGIWLTGRRLDHRTHLTGVVVLVGLAVGVGGLALTHATVATLLLVLVWGAAAASIPPVLNTAVIRVAPDAEPAASGAYVLAYQIGISSGSAIGAAVLAGAGAGGLARLAVIPLALGALAVIVLPRVFGSRDAAGAGTVSPTTDERRRT